MTIFAAFTQNNLVKSDSLGANMARMAVLVSAIALGTTITGCSKFQKSAIPVNQPMPLTKLSNTQHVLTPIFGQTVAHKSALHLPSFSVKNLNPFAKKQLQTLTQNPSAFQIGVDSQGYVAASADGSILATDAQGKRLWDTKLKQGLSSGVALDAASSTVVVSDKQGKLIALDRNTGKQRWQSQLTSSILAPTLISSNRVISLGNNGIVSANSLQTGELIWQFTTQNPTFSVRGTSTPTLLDAKTAIVATADGRVHAINIDNGVPLWSRRMGNAQGGSEIERLADIDATPVLNGNMLYVISYSGQLVAIDMTSRQLSFIKEYASIKSIAVDDTQLYLTTLDGRVAALDKLTGNVSWESDAVRYRGLSNPINAGNYVIVGDVLGYLHSFDKSTGKIIDRVSTRGGVSQLNLVDNRLIAENSNGGFSVWQVNR